MGTGSFFAAGFFYAAGFFLVVAFFFVVVFFAAFAAARAARAAALAARDSASASGSPGFVRFMSRSNSAPQPQQRIDLGRWSNSDPSSGHRGSFNG